MVKVHHLQYKLSRQSKKNSCVFLLDACCVKHTVCQWQKNLKTLVVSNIATFLVQDEGDRHLKHPPNPFSLGPWLFVGSTNLNILHIGKGVISQTVWLHCGHTLLEQFWTHSCGRDISIRLTLSSSLDTSFLVKLSVESSHPLNCATRMVSSWVPHCSLHRILWPVHASELTCRVGRVTCLRENAVLCQPDLFVTFWPVYVNAALFLIERMSTRRGGLLFVALRHILIRNLV